MALSYETYTGDGSNTNFVVPFPYISKGDVVAIVDGASAPFTWLSSSIIQMAVPPAAGKLVKIKRATPVANALVDFEDASTLTEADLDLSQQQMLYLAQEAADTLTNTVSSDDTTTEMNAHNKRIINVGNPINSQDAATRGWVESINNGAGAEAARLAAEAARDLALTYKNAAEAAIVLQSPRVHPDAVFNSLIPGVIFSCFGAGTAKTSIDLFARFCQLYNALSGWKGNTLYPTTTATYVSWLIGNDAGSGGRGDPVKTVKKALQISAGDIIIMDGDSREVLDLTASDRTVGGGTIARPMIIRAQNPGKVRFISPQKTMTEFSWTSAAGAGLAGGFNTTTNPTNLLLAVVRKVASTGPKAVNGFEYEPMPNFTSIAGLNAVQSGWYQDPGTLTIYFKYASGLDIEANKSSFELIYSASATLTDADGTMRGTTLYWEGVTFFGCKMPYLVPDPAKPTIRTVSFMKNCNFLFGQYSNFHSENADTFFQDCTSAYACNSDGFNYYDRASGSFKFLEVNCRAFNNGAFIQKTPYRALGAWSAATAYVQNDVVTVGSVEYICNVANTNQTPPNVTYWSPAPTGGVIYGGLGASNRNCQGSSAHGVGSGAHINGMYWDNYGQNIAHVLANPTDVQKIILIGVLSPSPWGFGAEGVIEANYPSIYLEGNAWLDNVQAGGTFSSYGVDSGPNSNIRVYQPHFTGLTAGVRYLGANSTYAPV